MNEQQSNLGEWAGIGVSFAVVCVFAALDAEWAAIGFLWSLIVARSLVEGVR